MDAFWLDHVLAACAALSGVVLVYGGWLCLCDLLDPFREWLLRRLRALASGSDAKEKERQWSR